MNTLKQPELSIESLPTSSLKPYPKNARTHSRQQRKQLAKSIRTNGLTNPILIDSENTIIAGHARVEAAKMIGMEQVPTIRLGYLTPEQVIALRIADNKIPENAGWDTSILAIELQHLLNIETDFDIESIGFEVAEIDLLLSAGDTKPDTDDAFGIEEGSNPVTQPGDMWKLGKHRILCGSATEEDSYSKLMDSKRAAMTLNDPPYNLRIGGHVSGRGAIRHREFPMGSGEMSETEFTAFLTSTFQLLARYSTAGSVHFCFMDFRHMSEILAAGKKAYDSMLHTCIWVKNVGGMGSLYRCRHELVFLFRNGKGKHRNNVQLGKFGRNRTDVWEYPSINGSSKTGDEGNLLALHPTVKPVRMLADALLDCSARGDLVLDVFLGSGSTLIAAERTGRICYGMELDPLYVDTAIKRWQRHTGHHAIHAVSGKRFDDIAKELLEVDRG